MNQQLGFIFVLLKCLLCNAGNGIIMDTTTGTFLIRPNEVPHVMSVNFGLPNYFRGAAVTLPDGNAYFLGGSSNSSLVPTTRVTRFDPSTNTSTAAAPMNVACMGHAATVVNNTIIVCGGYNNVTGTIFCEQSSIGVTSWTNITSLPTPAFVHVMVTLNGNAYVMGGWDNSTKVYMYNGATWITKASLSPGRYAHQALALDINRALICGGVVSGSYDATCVIYTASTDMYSSTLAMAKTRSYFSLVMSESMVECVVDRT
jgi:N-acetylneuraminic acid mutarotase